MYRIGIDIGGMSVKTGIVSVDGKIIKQIRTKTDKNPDIAVLNIVKDIDTLLTELNINKDSVVGIGIGCPGSIDSEKGTVIYSNNLGWTNYPLVKNLERKTGIKTKISNDANVATLGETVYGAGKGHNNSVMFTLGTGVGGGIVIDGKLYEGYKSQGAEPGHITLVFNGEQCSCGRKGCVEMYASATALIKQTKVVMKTNKDSQMWKYVDGDINKVDGKTAFECSKTGDDCANKVVNQYVAYLSEGIMNLFNIFRPEICIIGGGISAQGKYLTDKITAYCEQNFYGYKDAPKTKIVTAKLGNDAGIIGASCLFDIC